VPRDKYPERVVEFTARVDGKALCVELGQDAINRLVGPETRDENSLLTAMQRKIETVRIAIEAYVFARGLPMDDHFVLSARDLAAFVAEPGAANVSIR
jgi:hypothetical protein